MLERITRGHGGPPVLHIRLREEAHKKQLPQELQYTPYKIISILSVLFYIITLRNFIIKFQMLYFIPKHTKNNFRKRDLVFENTVNCTFKKIL
jgi:hypothetical protein